MANSLNTILRGRFYRQTPVWGEALCVALAASIVIGLLTVTQRRITAIRRLMIQSGLIAATLPAAYLAAAYLIFTRRLIVPPITATLISFAASALLGTILYWHLTGEKLKASHAELFGLELQLGAFTRRIRTFRREAQTPLDTISLRSELPDADSASERQRKRFAAIKVQADRLGELINDYLTNDD